MKEFQSGLGVLGVLLHGHKSFYCVSIIVNLTDAAEKRSTTPRIQDVVLK